MNTLAASPVARYRYHDVQGLRIHHLVYEPAVPGTPSTAAPTSEEAAAERWLARGNKVHFYWVEEGAYVLFASVPQALVDRHHATRRTAIAAWLQNNSGPQFQQSAG